MANPKTHHHLLNQQILKLPHKNDGSLNYFVLGNMLTATILGEVLEVSFVDQEFGKSNDQLLPDTDSNWQFHYKENDVVVFRKKQVNGKTHCFMGRGVVDAPMGEVVDYIHKFHSRLEWDDFLMQIEICKCISENDWLYYMAHEATQCLFTSRRDFFLYTRTGYVENKYVQTSISIEDKDYPHRPPYIRAQVMEGSGWVVEKHKGSECSTLLTYIVNMDLKELPSSLMDKVMKRQPMAIHHVRRKLTATLLSGDKDLVFSKSMPSAGSTTSNSDDEDTTQRHEMFEDTVPIHHYMNRKGTDGPTEIDPNTPMYPWVTDKRAMARRKLLAKAQAGNTTTDGELPSVDQGEQDSTNSTMASGSRYQRSLSWTRKTSKGSTTVIKTKETVGKSELSNSTGSIKDGARTLLNDYQASSQSQTTANDGDKQQRKEFPSFAAWAKDH